MPATSATPITTQTANVWQIQRWAVDHTVDGDALTVWVQAGLSVGAVTIWPPAQTVVYRGAKLQAIIADAASRAKPVLASAVTPADLASSLYAAIKGALYAAVQADGLIPSGPGVTVV